MQKRLFRAIRGWLGHELAERESRAEAALGQVFRALPPLLPPADLAEEVLARIGLAPAVWRPAPLAWQWKAAFALCASASAVAVAWLASWIGSFLAGFRPGAMGEIAAGLASFGEWLVATGAAALVAGGQALARGLRVWEVLAHVGDLVSEVVSSPPLLAALLGATLLSLAAFKVLHGLLVPERSNGYVSSI